MFSFPKLKIETSTLSFLLVGVGGQGTILASNILAELGMALGYDVKKAEVHGMSQRGGSVVSHLRWSDAVYSPIIARGEADIVIAYEKLEAARYAQEIQPGGLMLVNDYEIVPVTVSSGSNVYPQDGEIKAAIEPFTKQQYWINGVEIAESLGNARAANVVLLGALSALLDMPSDPWLQVLQNRVPLKYLDLNRQAFERGRSEVNAS